MNGAFSRIPLDALIERGYYPRAVVTPPPPGLPVAFRELEMEHLHAGESGDSIFGSAFRAGIPVYEIGDLGDPRIPTLLEGLDFLVTACFPRLLPQPWLDAPRQGCLNLHPSLLPAFRGPNPIEDQLAAGEQTTGITLHLMDATADTGPILLQEAFPIEAGAGIAAIDREAAERGAGLLLRYLAAPGKYPPRAQNE
jgi:methionyl-tRNA formyltransferase